MIPDVIDGSEEENDAFVYGWPLPKHLGVPVYHMHESLERLERLVWGGFSRIALGSSGRWADPGTDDWWARLSKMATILFDENGMPRCKLHGLRMLNTRIFSHLPLASADSCNVARSVGMDTKWNGTYQPKSAWVRALIMMDRIEQHAAAARWCGSNGVQHNLELLG